MTRQRVLMGAGLLALLAGANIVVGLVGNPPTAALVLIVILGLADLGALSAWLAGRSRRAAMWVAVIAAAAAALLAVLALFIPTVPSSERIFFVVFIALTVTGAVLVRDELRRQTPGESAAGARVA
jgi:hypothetical protein